MRWILTTLCISYAVLTAFVSSTTASLCYPPPLSTNLKYHPVKATYNSGETIYYACAHELTVFPQNKSFSVCGADGSWDIGTNAPECKPGCPRPPGIMTGQGSFSPNKETYERGSNVQYSCVNITFLVGDASAVCQNDTLWYPSQPPTCLDGCPAPPPPGSNSTRNGTHPTGYSRQGTQVRYDCDPGFTSRGTNVLTCNSAAVWIPVTPPSCFRVCSAPPQPTGGSGGSSTPVLAHYPVGTEISYKCQGTFNVNGPGSNKCKSDGTWKYSTGPICASVCFAPANIQRGSYQSSQVFYPLNAVVVYTCDSGYVLSNTTAVTCQAGLRWSHVPQCLKRDVTLDLVYLFEANENVESVSCTNKEVALGTSRPFGPGGVLTPANFPNVFQQETFLERFERDWRRVEPDYTRLAIQVHSGPCTNAASKSLRTLASNQTIASSLASLQIACGTPQPLSSIQCMLDYQLTAAQGARVGANNSIIIAFPNIVSATGYSSSAFRNAYLTGLNSYRSRISDIFTISLLNEAATDFAFNKLYLEEFACGTTGGCTRFLGSVYNPDTAITRLRSYYNTP